MRNADARVPARFRRRTLLSAVALLALPPAACAQAEVDCVVERVSDGDSITCGGERVRLLSIDAPELDQEPFGRAAQAFLQAVLPVGARARLELDVERRDQHGRLLAYVFRGDGQMVNRMMARQGFALAYVLPPNLRHVRAIRAAADSARAGRFGLWAIDAFECAPADHRAGRCD
jgi:micrococcal nuclease